MKKSTTHPGDYFEVAARVPVAFSNLYILWNCSNVQYRLLNAYYYWTLLLLNALQNVSDHSIALCLLLIASKSDLQG
jgi:hypothetical protein